MSRKKDVTTDTRDVKHSERVLWKTLCLYINNLDKMDKFFERC